MRLLVGFDGDTWHHERVALYPLVFGDAEEWWILTADGDQYLEKRSDWVYVLELRDGVLPRGISGPVVQFGEAIGTAMMKEFVLQARRGVRVLRAEKGVPEHLGGEFGVEPSAFLTWEGVAKPLGADLSLRALRDRLVGPQLPERSPQSKGGQVAEEESGAQDIDGDPAPFEPGEGHVWLCDEVSPHGSGFFGRTVEMRAGDVVLEDRGVHKTDRGLLLSVRRVPTRDLAGFARDFRAQVMDITRAGPDDPGPDLRERLGRPREEPPKVQAAAEKVKEEWPESTGDPRTLCVDTDPLGTRFKDWRNVCHESWSEPLPGSPVLGPSTSLRLCYVYLQNGGDPHRWMELWCREHGLSKSDRVYHEMKTLISAIYIGGTFDQVNLGGLAMVEVLARRAQAISQAYKQGANGKPNFSAADLFLGEDVGADGVTNEITEYAVQRAKQRNALDVAAGKAFVGKAANFGGGGGADDDGAGVMIDSGSPAGRGRGGGRGRARRQKAPAPVDS